MTATNMCSSVLSGVVPPFEILSLVYKQPRAIIKFSLDSMGTS